MISLRGRTLADLRRCRKCSRLSAVQVLPLNRMPPLIPNRIPIYDDTYRRRHGARNLRRQLIFRYIILSLLCSVNKKTQKSRQFADLFFCVPMLSANLYSRLQVVAILRSDTFCPREHTVGSDNVFCCGAAERCWQPVDSSVARRRPISLPCLASFELPAPSSVMSIFAGLVDVSLADNLSMLLPGRLDDLRHDRLCLRSASLYRGLGRICSVSVLAIFFTITNDP